MTGNDVHDTTLELQIVPSEAEWSEISQWCTDAIGLRVTSNLYLLVGASFAL